MLYILIYKECICWSSPLCHVILCIKPCHLWFLQLGKNDDNDDNVDSDDNNDNNDNDDNDNDTDGNDGNKDKNNEDNEDNDTCFVQLLPQAG